MNRGFKLAVDPLLLPHMMRLRLFSGGIEQLPRPRDAGGNRAGERRGGAHSKKIRRQNQHERSSRRKRRPHRDCVDVKMQQHRNRRRESKQQQPGQPDREKPENLWQRNFFEARQVVPGFLLRALKFFKQFVLVRRKVGQRPLAFRQ